jgi:hypothetical protein
MEQIIMGRNFAAEKQLSCSPLQKSSSSAFCFSIVTHPQDISGHVPQKNLLINSGRIFLKDACLKWIRKWSHAQSSLGQFELPLRPETRFLRLHSANNAWEYDRFVLGVSSFPTCPFLRVSAL